MVSLVESFNGNKYCVFSLTILQNIFGFIPWKKKSNVLDIFIRFKVLLEKIYNKQIIQLYTDNGGEYLALKIFLAHLSVFYLTTSPLLPILLNTMDTWNIISVI